MPNNSEIASKPQFLVDNSMGQWTCEPNLLHLIQYTLKYLHAYQQNYSY